MLFLVKGEVVKRGYMSNRDESEIVMHPVEADSREEASEIFGEHYKSMSSPYAVSYSVYIHDIFETLSRPK
jgi:hypothetical protein